jgi:hypothetical protein
MKKILLLIICGMFISTNIAATDFSKQSMVTPVFLRASETDVLFRNPAELTLHERVAEGRLHYGLSNEKFGGSFILHMPDNMPMNFNGGGTPLAIGDFAFSMEFFGSNFSQNMMWVNDDDGGHFSVADGGYKMLFTWAKKTEFLTVGANLKTYHYRDITNPDSERNSVGLDLGAFFTPFKDLYLGISASDIGGSLIKDSNGNAVEDANGNKTIIEQEYRFTAAVLSGKDMAFSVGIPLSLAKELKEDPKHAWKKVSFQGSKTFDNWLQITAGSNSKDVYGAVTIKANDFVDFGVIAACDLYNEHITQYTLTVSAGYPIDKMFEQLGNKKSEPQPKNNSKYRKSRKEIREEKTLTREKKLERKMELMEDELDTLKRQDLKKSKPTSVYDEVEKDLDEEIRELKRKKRKLKSIKRKKERALLERELDEELYD